MKSAMFRSFWVVLALTFCGLGTPALAQTVKIAVVDLNKAMNEVEEGKAAIAKLEKRFADKRAELEKMGKQIEAMQSDLELKGQLLSDQAKKDRYQEIQTKMMEFQQAQLEANQEMAGLQQNLQDALAEKLKEVCASIAQKEGYTLVVEKSVVWYSPASYDITAKLIAAYNAKATAAKPK